MVAEIAYNVARNNEVDEFMMKWPLKIAHSLAINNEASDFMMKFLLKMAQRLEKQIRKQVNLR